MYGLGAAVSGLADGLDEVDAREQKKDDIDRRREVFNKRMARDDEQAGWKREDRATRLTNESVDRQYKLDDREFVDKQNDMTRGLDSAVRSWRFNKNPSVLGEWATKYMNMGDVDVSANPDGGYVASGVNPDSGEKWDRAFKDDRELGSMVMMMANPSSYLAQLNKPRETTTVSKDASLVDAKAGKLLYKNSGDSKGGAGYSGPPGSGLSKYNVQKGEMDMYRIIADNKGGKFENNSFDFGGDSEKANQASFLGRISSELHLLAVKGELPWRPANTWASVAIKAGKNLLTEEQAKVIAEESASKQDPIGPDFMRPGASAQAYGTNEAGEPLSREEFIKVETTRLLDESYQKTEQAAMALVEKLSQSPQNDQPSSKNNNSEALNFSASDREAAKKDPVKYREILMRANKGNKDVTEADIDAQVASRFPDAKKVQKKALEKKAAPKTIKQRVGDFNTPEVRSNKAKSEAEKKKQLADSMKFIENNAKNMRDKMGFTKDGKANMKKAKSMSDAMLRIKKQLKDKRIDNWGEFSKDAKSASVYLSDAENKMVKALIDSQKANK